ncbi:hypothetical protein GWK47_051235 [Chionoecetes opilio]|uniref:Uncharacterized protein n=1 Tax=Chionoecetes opilio TaxID=41210 RepID=A0A8J4YD07_CHIOP|nr:hypothetical protein GWK47_051235 [Chionoecetes opilio]
MDLLEAWGLTGVITALVFDTTASNSGVHRGAAKLLEQQLDRKVFCLACRHHILEVLVGAIWENLFGKVKSPENPWFKHFKDAWTDLTTDNPTTLSIRQKWLNKKKKECKEILQEILRSEKPPRADYVRWLSLPDRPWRHASPRNPLESSWSHSSASGWPETCIL